MSADVQIDVITNKMTGEKEGNHWRAGGTFNEYIAEHVPAFRPEHTDRFSFLRNGADFPQSQWDQPLQVGDHVVVTVEPKGATVVAMAIITAASAYYAYRAAQNIPDNYNKTSPTGSAIYNVNAQGNKAALMAPVPILCGTHKLFPSYLVMPRREWFDHEQYLFLMMLVCADECELPLDQVFIGETSITALGDDVHCEIFAPGADVSGNPAHRAEYHAEEVSVNGQGGLELAGPIYAEDWQVEDGEDYWQWQVQSANTLGLWHYIYDDGLLFYGFYGHSGWHDNYNDVHSGSLIGKVVEFYGNGPATDGLYRPVSQNGDGDTVTFERLNDDLTVDTSWTGFGATGSFFICRWRLWGDDLSGKYAGPFSAVPANVATNQIRLDFLYSGGLARQTGGAPDYHSSTITVEWREQGETAWNSQTYLFTDNTLDQRVYTVTIDVVSARPEVRVSKLSGGKGVMFRDDVTWVALRSEMRTATSYPGWTTAALRIRASNNLSGTAERKVSMIPTSKLPELVDDGDGDGTYSWSAPVATSQPSAIAAHALRKCGHDDVIPRDVLWQLQQTWSARGDEFNAVFDSAGKLWESLKRIFAVGFATPTLDYGQIIPVRDEPRTGFAQGFQASNMRPNSLKRRDRLISPVTDEYDGVEVEYFSNESWSSETIRCLIGDDLGVNPKKIRAYGITDKTKAYRFGMRARAIDKYRRRQYVFSTEMDGLNAKYLSRIAVGWDMPRYSQTGMLEAATRLGGDPEQWSLTLDLPVDWVQGATHYIGLHKPTGEISGPYVATAGGGKAELIITGPLDFSPDFSGAKERPRYQFGTADTWTQPCLVEAAKPSGTDRVSIASVLDDPRAYQYDDSVPV